MSSASETLQSWGRSSQASLCGTVGTVVNHIGFTVPNVQEAVAKWKAAGVPFEPGAPGRLNQGWVTTTDGLKIEIQEDKDQKEPIRSKHVHFFLPENAIAESQAWYGKVFGAKASVLNNAPVADVPGVQLRWNKASVAEGPTKGRVLDHIGFDVKDLKAFIAKMEAAGTRLRAVRWRSRNSGLLTISPMSFDTRFTTAIGVPAGAKMPYQLFDGGPL